MPWRRLPVLAGPCPCSGSAWGQVFLATWGIDKVVATQGFVGIFPNFYRVELGALPIRIIGRAEILLSLALAAGRFRVFTAWAQLLVNCVSTVASWKRILDPWDLLGLTNGGAHLSLASIVITAAAIVLVFNARDPPLTRDRQLRRNEAT